MTDVKMLSTGLSREWMLQIFLFPSPLCPRGTACLSTISGTRTLLWNPGHFFWNTCVPLIPCQLLRRGIETIIGVNLV